VAEMIYPSPSQPDRYVLLIAATSTQGMRQWNVASYIDPVYGFPTTNLDWLVYDGRLAKLEAGLSPDRIWIASGVFDMQWRRDDRWTFTGATPPQTRDTNAAAPSP